MKKQDFLFIIVVFNFLSYDVSCQTFLTEFLTNNNEYEPRLSQRIARQAGYNYNKPNVPFELPSGQNQATITVTAKPIVVSDTAQPQQGNYAYPSPSSVAPPAPAPAEDKGYDIPVPESPQPKQSDSYNYKPPTVGKASNSAGADKYSYNAPSKRIDDSGSSNSAADEKYSYNAPSKRIDDSGSSNSAGDEKYSYNAPSKPIEDFVSPTKAPAIVISSTGAPEYLPPKIVSKPVLTSYQQPIQPIQVSNPSISTPGQPYLPPKLPSPAPPPLPSPPAGNPSNSYIPPPQKPSGRPVGPKYVPPSSSKNSGATPVGGPAKIPNSYLAPQTNSASKSTSPGNSYVPPAPSAFRPPQFITSPPQAVSTPAPEYLPPYK